MRAHFEFSQSKAQVDTALEQKEKLLSMYKSVLKDMKHDVSDEILTHKTLK